MDSFVNQSSFSCDMKIIRAKNVQPLKSTQQLFVRCYLSTTTNNKIRLETQEISPKSDLFWNKSFSLDCRGNQESIAMLMHGSVVLELRLRNTGTLLRKIGSSKLLGIAEIPWKSVVESPNMEIVKWAVIKAPKNSKYSSRVMNDEDVNPTIMEFEMKVRVPKLMADQTVARKTRWDGECRCMDCACSNTSFDFEFFALGAAL